MSNKSASHLSAGVKSSLLNTGHKRYYRLKILKHFFNETCQKKIIVWLGRSFSVLCRMPRLRKSYQFSQKNHSRYCWCSKHSAMWSVARPWLVPFPRRCWNWNAHLVCFWKPLWNKVSRMVEWHSSHSSWGLSLQTSLLHLVFKLLLLCHQHSSQKLWILLCLLHQWNSTVQSMLSWLLWHWLKNV